MTPGPGQARLEPMVGTFNVKIRAWVAANKPPVESTAVAVSVWVLGHRYIQSMLSGYVLNEPFDGIGYTAYDNVSNVTSTREEVVINFGINQNWDLGQKEMDVELLHRIILSPHGAKRLHILLVRSDR